MNFGIWTFYLLGLAVEKELVKTQCKMESRKKIINWAGVLRHNIIMLPIAYFWFLSLSLRHLKINKSVNNK